MKKTAIIFMVLLFALPVYSQQDESFSDFYRQRMKEMKDWRAKANAEFSEYLASAWEEFLVQRGKKDPIGPVPDKPIEAAVSLPGRQYRKRRMSASI